MQRITHICVHLFSVTSKELVGGGLKKIVWVIVGALCACVCVWHLLPQWWYTGVIHAVEGLLQAG